mgnify:CR=1 FL=1
MTASIGAVVTRPVLMIYFYHNAHTYFKANMRSNSLQRAQRRAQKSLLLIQNPIPIVIRKPMPLASRIGPSPPSRVTPTVSPTIFA